MEKYDIIIFVRILIKLIIGTLKRYGNLFNKLLIKSNIPPTFKRYCQNRENYKISSFLKNLPNTILSQIMK